MHSQVNTKEINRSEYPHIENGDKVATFKDRDGNELFGVVLSSHPFDGDDFKCGVTGKRFTGIWKSGAWYTAKVK